MVFAECAQLRAIDSRDVHALEVGRRTRRLATCVLEGDAIGSTLCEQNGWTEIRRFRYESWANCMPT